MQRWIMVAVIGAVLLGLATAGAGYAWWNARQNADAPVWSVLPINPELPADQREEVADEIRRHVSDPKLLATVAGEHNITNDLKLGSDAEAAEFLLDRLFVRVGDVDTGMGRVPAILIGFNGTKREFKTLGNAATGVLKHVMMLVGAAPER